MSFTALVILSGSVVKSCSRRIRESKPMIAASPWSPMISGAIRLPILLHLRQNAFHMRVHLKTDHQRDRLVRDVHLDVLFLAVVEQVELMRLQTVDVVAVAVEDQHRAP